MAKDDILICSACGAMGTPEVRVKGSFLVEMVLWLCFIIPGVIYSLWRMSSKERVCRTCGSTSLLPLSSPMGHQLARQAPHAPPDHGPVEPPSGATHSDSP